MYNNIVVYSQIKRSTTGIKLYLHYFRISMISTIY